MSKPVLVTGGTGFVGKALVRQLVAAGQSVRVLTRVPANSAMIRDLGGDAVVGDVNDIDSFGHAMMGCDTVVHLAAGTSSKDARTTTVQGTRNLLSLCRRHRPQRLVYISSCSVYGVADYDTGAVVTETSSLERFPERRGAYSASKQEAERYVTEFQRAGDVPTVVLRPGMIYGPDGELYTPLVGLSVGSTYIVIGSGREVLPLVNIIDLVHAILLSMTKDEAVGQIFNVVDPEPLDKRTYMDRVIRALDPEARVVYFPYSLLYGITWLQERLFALMNRTPVVSCYRLVSSQKRVRYDSSRVIDRLGWTPLVSLEDAVEQLVRSESSGNRSPIRRLQPSASDVVESFETSRRQAGSRSAR